LTILLRVFIHPSILQHNGDVSPKDSSSAPYSRNLSLCFHRSENPLHSTRSTSGAVTPGDAAIRAALVRSLAARRNHFLFKHSQTPAPPTYRKVSIPRHKQKTTVTEKRIQLQIQTADCTETNAFERVLSSGMPRCVPCNLTRPDVSAANIAYISTSSCVR
jgi:hypothetical protein